MDRERKLRRDQDLLVVIGTGVILFGVWDVIRLLMMVLVGDAQLASFYDGQPPEDRPIITVILIFFFIIYLAVEMSLRLHIGRSARAEGMGKKRGSGYVVWAALLGVLYAASMVLAAMSLNQWGTIEDMTSAIVTFVIDVTSVIMLFEMVLAAARVKRERKNAGED